MPSVAKVIVVCVGGCSDDEAGEASGGEELVITEVVLLWDSFELKLVIFALLLLGPRRWVTGPVLAVIAAIGESALAVFSTGKRNDESNRRKAGIIARILKFMWCIQIRQVLILFCLSMISRMDT